jgi:hypothetical protein
LEGKNSEENFVGKEGSNGTALEAKNDIIDRIYTCKDCHNTFVYTAEVDHHKKTAGHKNFREYPVF